MIIEGLLNLLYGVFSFLTQPIDLPALPVQLHEVLDVVLQCVSYGLSIVAVYVNLPYLLILFGIIIAVDQKLFIYKVVLWVIKKIPFVGIE